MFHHGSFHIKATHGPLAGYSNPHPHAIAYDWIRDTLFWTDTINGKLAVTQKKTNDWKTFYVKSINETNLFDIAVHPVKG